jgi:Na+-driven multidrug efflux pump
MASGDQTEIGRELLLVPEASYIFHFCQNGHTAYRSYSRNAVNEVITIGIPALRAQCIGLFFVPFQVCNNMMFQSIGYRFNATFLSSLRNGAFFIPVLLFFAWRYGLPGIQVSQMVADVLTCLTCVPFTVSFFRKISSAEPEQE